MEKYLRVGVITSPHGVRGEVKGRDTGVKDPSGKILQKHGHPEI